MEKIRNIIDEIGICSSVKTNYPDYYSEFKTLFVKHPSKKATNMIDLNIIKSQWGDKQVQIINNNGKLETISWRACFSKNKPKTDSDRTNLIKAMRTSIVDQIISFKKEFNNSFKCNNCGLEGNISSEFHADHIFEFKKLSEEFLKNREVPKEFFFKNGACYFVDLDFEKQWVSYHKNNCSLRILCSKCNLSRSSKNSNY